MIPLPLHERPRERLPERVLITPSKINPWRWPLKPDARFTDEQLYWLDRAGIKPDEVETLTVLSPVGYRDGLWWPVGTPATVYAIECPIIRRREPDQVLVVSPAGFEKWVYADGSISRRSR